MAWLHGSLEHTLCITCLDVPGNSYVSTASDTPVVSIGIEAMVIFHAFLGDVFLHGCEQMPIMSCAHSCTVAICTSHFAQITTVHADVQS